VEAAPAHRSANEQAVHLPQVMMKRLKATVNRGNGHGKKQ